MAVVLAALEREVGGTETTRSERVVEDFRTKTCFCGNPLPKRFGMAWCDDCLVEFAESPEGHRMFIRRKEVARGRI